MKIWSTTDLLTGEETEERVRTTTRELAIYMVFMGVLCWVTLSATHVTMFQYTSQLKNLFKSQEEVVQVADFWNFMENDFLDGLYWEEWYNEGTLPNKFPCDLESKGVKGLEVTWCPNKFWIGKKFVKVCLHSGQAGSAYLHSI